jgi:hypothetical protein
MNSLECFDDRVCRTAAGVVHTIKLGLTDRDFNEPGFRSPKLIMTGYVTGCTPWKKTYCAWLSDDQSQPQLSEVFEAIAPNQHADVPFALARPSGSTLKWLSLWSIQILSAESWRSIGRSVSADCKSSTTG